jgi:squalene-hopene/tetraprenyl-beta-curcumene cyclase
VAVRAIGSQLTDVERALHLGVDHLLGLQDPAGWFKGELETNVTMDAEDLFLRQFLGVRTEGQTRSSAYWIRRQQRDDGTWSNFFGGPPDLSTTIEAYVALRLAGDPTDAAHMRGAAAFVRDFGGLESARVFTKMWFSIFGLWDWDHVPALPPEVMFLPSWVPLNIYDFACWARQTLVALTVVGAHRPNVGFPFPIDELRTGIEPPDPPASIVLRRLDRLLRRYEQHPWRPLRRMALSKAEDWIVERQEADGSWGGIQPPWVYSMMALHLQGYPLDHPVMRKGLEGLDAFTIIDERGRRLEACQSPVWDTALAVIALADAGLPPDHPALQGAGEWLADEEIDVRGDWAVKRPNLAPGGWAFEFANVNYPDIDDTAEVILALHRIAEPPSGAVERGIEWVVGMQCSDGGWAAFDADNHRTAVRDLPFCDFGEVIDPPSADVTAHVVEMLAHQGLRAHPDVARGIDWLLGNQEDDGSWFGRWGANHVYGTGAVIPALVEAGVDRDAPAVRAAVGWILNHQNADGGWGEDLRSYRDPAWVGRGESTPSQTAWALLALLAAGERGEATERGIAYLVANQLDDGGWDEPYFTGTGFPGDFYINYHLYRVVFPVMALGRYLEGER